MGQARIILRTAVVSIASFCISFISLQYFSAEYRAVLLKAGTTNDVISVLSGPQPDLPTPSSARTMRDILSTCGRVLTLSPRLKAEPDLAEIVAARCKSMTDTFLTTSPLNGRALAIGLLASKRIDADTLKAAQRAAPYEPWPLNIRLQAVASAENLAPETLPLIKEDFARALLSQWGREVLADLYITHPPIRPLVTQAADAAAPQDQRQFLNILRREMRGRA